MVSTFVAQESESSSRTVVVLKALSGQRFMVVDQVAGAHLGAEIPLVTATEIRHTTVTVILITTSFLLFTHQK